MSSLFQMFAASSEPADTVRYTTGSSVLGVTGLPRRMLATLLLQNGLFGRESDLAPIEQAIVQDRIGPVPGLTRRALPAPTDTRLQALDAFADRVVRASGGVSRTEEAQLVAAGFNAAAVSEVVRVVRTVRDVFGLQAQPRVDAVREGVVYGGESFARAA